MTLPRWTAWLLAAGPLVAAAQGGSLSLREAAAAALESHPAIEASMAVEAASEHGIRAAEAGALPRLSWSESYLRSNNPVFAFGTLLNQRRFAEADFALDRLNNPASVQNFQSLVRVEQIVFDARRAKHAVRAAQLTSELSSEERRERQAEVLLGVVRTYFGVELGARGLAVAEQAVESAEADLRRAQALYEAGQTTKADVVSIEAHLADAQQRRIAAEAEAEIAAAALNDALGKDLDTQHELTTPLAAVGEPRSSLADYLERAAKERPNLRRAALAARVAEAQAAGAKSALWPRVTAQGVLKADTARLVTRGGGNWAAGASMQWDLWKGGENRARLGAARQRKVAAEARGRQARSSAALEIRRAHAATRSANERLAVAEAALSSAEESLRIIRNRYENGLENVTALLRAETVLTGTRYRQLAVLYEQRTAVAALEKAAGVLSLDSEALQ